MSEANPLEQLESILDEAWETELAAFFNNLYLDLRDGFITAEQALYQIQQIRRK